MREGGVTFRRASAATSRRPTGRSSAPATSRPTTRTARRPTSPRRSSRGSPQRCRDHLLLVDRRARRPTDCARRSTSSTATTLWGRYWGTIEYVAGLHFEACYYQAIEFCIERGIARFEGGAQGVHKLARGLLPVTTSSAHAIADPTSPRRSRTSARASASTSRTPSTSSRPRARSGTARARRAC